MILPRLEAETELGQFTEAFAKFRVTDQTRRYHPGGEPADGLTAIPCDAVTDSAQAPATDGHFSFQQLAHARADGKVAAADNRLGDAAGAIVAGSAHGRDSIDELDLAQRRHLARPILAVHRPAFEEDG